MELVNIITARIYCELYTTLFEQLNKSPLLNAFKKNFKILFFITTQGKKRSLGHPKKLWAEISVVKS